MSSYALLIGVSQFTDPKLNRLNAPRSDVEAFARVLRDPERGGFASVMTCIDQELQATRDQLASLLLHERNPDDLVLVYYSGHGIITRGQRLFLATRQSRFDYPQAASLSAAEVRDWLEQSRAGKQVVILDCCHSGAFGEGAKGVVQAVNPDTFGDGEGQYILTATDALQFAYDSSGSLKEGSAPPALSRFTGWLVDAIGKGEAAPDSERITLDAVFDYLSHRARLEAVGMTPKRFVRRNSGEMVIARNPLAMPAALPEEIVSGLDDKDWRVRRDAVVRLGKLADQPRYRDLVEEAIFDRIGTERDHVVKPAMKTVLRKLGSAEPAVSDPAAQPVPVSPRPDAPSVSHPIGQFPPGSPDAGVPRSGQMPRQDSATGGGVGNRLPQTGDTEPRRGRAKALLSGIIVLLSSPMQVALYPIAGSAGLLAGSTIYLLLYLVGSSAVETEVVSVLTVFAITLERLPVEFKFAENHPLYPKMRHWIRLIIVAGGIVSLLMLNDAAQRQEFPALYQDNQNDSLANRLFGYVFMAILPTILLHLLLRSVTARRVWDGLIQTVLELRKA